jgi:hypothetical protein
MENLVGREERPLIDSDCIGSLGIGAEYNGHISKFD